MQLGIDGGARADGGGQPGGARAVPRDHGPEIQWNLADLYPSDEAWRAEKEKLAASLGEAKAFAGTLGTSPAQLAKALATQSAQDKTLARLFAYANLLADQDTRVSGPQGMTDEMTQWPRSLAPAGRSSSRNCSRSIRKRSKTGSRRLPS